MVIPVYDEADNIVELVREVRSTLEGRLRYEILVVDDGSRDDTVARLRAYRGGAGTPVRILRHRTNAGQSAALCSGVRAARAEWIATLDGDGQNDPADIPALYARTGDPTLAAICGQRVRRNDDLLRRLSSRIANGVRARVLHDATPDTGCGLKLIRRTVFMQLPWFDHMHRFIPALVQQAGYRTESVPVSHRPRLHGRSKYGIGNRLWVGLGDLAGVAWLGRRRWRTQCDEVDPQ
ncbi:MAG: glycosyltransferase family 2 protein [Gammaproteobacteria bacterium]